MDSARGVAAIVVCRRNSSCNSSCDAIAHNGRRTIALFLLRIERNSLSAIDCVKGCSKHVSGVVTAAKYPPGRPPLLEFSIKNPPPSQGLGLPLPLPRAEKIKISGTFQLPETSEFTKPPGSYAHFFFAFRMNSRKEPRSSVRSWPRRGFSKQLLGSSREGTELDWTCFNQKKRYVRKISALNSVAAPILWAPGIFWFFLQENPHMPKKKSSF